jgi:integrase
MGGSVGEEPRVPGPGLSLEGRQPLDHGNVNRQQFKRLLKKAVLPPMRPYDIRHSFATLWIESGESAEVLQKVLGHSSIATTINTYSYLSPRYQRESFGRFGDALGGR